MGTWEPYLQLSCQLPAACVLLDRLEPLMTFEGRRRLDSSLTWDKSLKHLQEDWACLALGRSPWQVMDTPGLPPPAFCSNPSCAGGSGPPEHPKLCPLQLTWPVRFSSPAPRCARSTAAPLFLERNLILIPCFHPSSRLIFKTLESFSYCLCLEPCNNCLMQCQTKRE